LVTGKNLFKNLQQKEVREIYRWENSKRGKKNVVKTEQHHLSNEKDCEEEEKTWSSSTTHSWKGRRAKDQHDGRLDVLTQESV